MTSCGRMRRPQPIRRLVDGSPHGSGRAVVRRAIALLVPATLAANVLGAAVVVVLVAFVLPTPELDDSDHVLLVNVAAAGAYVVVACIVGTLWGLRQMRQTRAWLEEERAPDDEERRRTLRAPLRLMRINGGLWILAALAFGALNATWSALLAVIVVATVVLGGVTTCASVYLSAERILRAASSRALAHGVPERPLLPGVTTRALLAWALGSGVPMVGLGTVAVVALATDEVGVDELALTALALGGVVLSVGLIVTLQAARAVAEPVLSVRRALREVEEGDLAAEVPVFDGSEMGLLQAGFNRTVSGLREREELRDLFGRHVGEEVARAAQDRGIELGGEERIVAVVFVDLVGSTSLAEERDPKDVVALLNEFFAVVVEVVERHGGWINKFMGDAALAVFGAPIPREDAADSALAAARELAERLPREVPDLEAGIGVSAGRVVAGNIGTESRFEYTVIGDPVNEAARLCELAKREDKHVLASCAALDRVEDGERERWRVGDPVELRGRREPTRPAAPA
jgi:adenylate cyclase